MSRWLISVFVLAVPLSAHAAKRTWHFDLKTSGTYEVHVQHRIGAVKVPLGAVANYAFHSREKTLQRDIPFFHKDDSHPVPILIVHGLQPQKAKVIISGLPKPLLEQTSVYVIDVNSRYPYEWFDPEKSVDLKTTKIIRGILKQPDQEIDLARAKLTIDKLIDARIDVTTNMQKIDAMAAEIKAMPNFGHLPTAKLHALKRYLHEPGTWNNYRPFQYDLNDPLGTKLSNKLLPHYLATKQGNCVTMPFLFIVLAQRLGIDVTAATAPLHILVKFRDESGVWYNLETTSGANPARDVWYRQQMTMTDQAIANGVYLRPLTRRETVALMATTLAEHYVDHKELEKAISLSDLILEYHPKDVDSMIRKSNAYYDLANKYYLKKFRSFDDIPDRAKGHYSYLLQNNLLWSAKAKNLGWQEPSKEESEKYLQRVSQEYRLKE